MQARAGLVVRREPCGRTVPTVLRGEAPLLLRATDLGGERAIVHLVGGAAGPLGGDRLLTEVDVGEGAALVVRSVAASLAQPDRQRRSSVATVRAAVGPQACLDWHPQPLVSVRGSDHVQRVRIDCAAGARLRWVDEVVLGRHEEPGGRLTLAQRVTMGGSPVIHHDVTFDPRTHPNGTIGRARAIVSIIEIGLSVGAPSGRDHGVMVSPSVRAARTAVGPSSTLWIGLGDDLDRAWAGLEEIGCGRVSREGTTALTNTSFGHEDAPVVATSAGHESEERRIG